MRKCTRCGGENTTQTQKWCSDCKREYDSKYYSQPSKRFEQQQRIKERKKEIRDWLKEVKSEKKIECIRCGEDHPACLDFHHIDPEKKEATIGGSRKGSVLFRGWSKERIQKEIEKCEVLCSNCHRKEHWVMGLQWKG